MVVLGASVVVTCVVPMVVDTVLVVDEVIAVEYFKHFELDKALTAPMPSGRSHTSPGERVPSRAVSCPLSLMFGEGCASL